MWVWSDASMVYFFDFQIRACSCTLVAPCLHPREDQARIWKNRQVREVPLPPATTSENSQNWWSGRLSALYHRDRLDQDLIMLRWWPTLLIVFIKVETSIKHVWLCLGKDPATKSDEFVEKCQRGEGGASFSIQKFMLQILGYLNRAFEHEIDKKKGNLYWY